MAEKKRYNVVKQSANNVNNKKKAALFSLKKLSDEKKKRSKAASQSSPYSYSAETEARRIAENRERAKEQYKTEFKSDLIGGRIEDRRERANEHLREETELNEGSALQSISEAVGAAKAISSGNAAYITAYTSTIAVEKAVEKYKKELKEKEYAEKRVRAELYADINDMKAVGIDKLAAEYTTLIAKAETEALTKTEMNRLLFLSSTKSEEIGRYIAVSNEYNKTSKAIKTFSDKQKNNALKSASKIGNSIKTVAEATNSGDDAGEAAVNTVTALPMHYAQEAARDKFNEVFNQKIYLSKRSREAAARKSAEKASFNNTEVQVKKELAEKQFKSNYARNQWKSQQKTARLEAERRIQEARKAFYIKNAGKAAATAGAEAGGTSAGAAAAGGGAPVILMVAGIIICVLLASIAAPAALTMIFSWQNNHTETLYNNSSKSYETLDLIGETELLEGYIKHIQDWFDKKQISILQVTDLKYGGFDPDDYEYVDKVSNEKTKIQYEYGIDVTLKRTLKYTVVTGQFTKIYNYVEQTDTDTKSTVAFYKVYYKYKDENVTGGLLEYCEPTDDYDYCDTIIAQDIDLNAYYQTAEYQTLHNQHPSTYPIYTYDNGMFSEGESITDITVKRSDGTEKLLTEWLVDLTDPAVKSLYTGTFRNWKEIPYDSSKSGIVGNTEGDPILVNEELIQAAFTDRPNPLSMTASISSPQGIFDPNIWTLNEIKNEEKWIKLPDEIDFEGIIALAAVRKWQQIEASNGALPEDHAFHITDDDLDYVLNNVYTFEYHYDYGACRDEDCCYYMANGHRNYFCGHKLGHVHASAECKQKEKNQAHKHLTGKVVNNAKIGGISFLMDKVLNTASPYYEQDKQIYDIYKQYINEKLGTSTKLDDYENDKNAQTRLYKKYLLMSGIGVPNAPKNVRVGNYNLDLDNAYCIEDNPSVNIGEEYIAHIPITVNISWEAPDEAEATNVQRYNVYVYTEKGYKELVGTTTDTKIKVNMTKKPIKDKTASYGWYWASNAKEGAFPIKMKKKDNGSWEYSVGGMPADTIYGGSFKKFILVTAVNEFGESLVDRKELVEMDSFSNGKILRMFAGTPITKHNLELVTYPKAAKIKYPSASAGQLLDADNGTDRKVQVIPDPD